MQIDIVSDVICPWCFIGKRRLERALALRPDLPATLSWRAFELNPDMPSAGISRELYLAAKFSGSLSGSRAAGRSHAAVCAAGRIEGIDFAFERIRRTPNTLRAHRLIRLAASEGCADEMVEALFRAYFVEGLDIGDIETLAAIAPRVGLDAEESHGYLIGEAGTNEVRAEEHRARRLGIHAVPCFVLDRGYAISGAQEPEMFLPLFDVAVGVVDPAPAEV
jgi:predicted DsbA family dithiol-disulfide isomerase